MIGKYLKLLESLGIRLHISEDLASDIAQVIAIITLAIVCYFLYIVTKFIIKKVLWSLIKKSSSKFDDFFLNNGLAIRLSLLAPIFAARSLITSAAPDFDTFNSIIILIAKVLEIITYTGIIYTISDSLVDIYNSFDVSKSRPIKGFVQVVKTILAIACILLVIAILTNKDIKNILIGLGTLSAVLMLVFKDPILGFVGGLQLSINDMVRIGDWIVKGNADGVVTDIGITSVKVQNWDNTITTIPTYSLISDPFTNWRGMSESGGRRISRSFVIDADSVQFCTPEMLARFKQFQLVSNYITEKEDEIEKYNIDNNIDTSTLVNGRRQTNLGIFRAYLKQYLLHNPNINKNLTVMVRQKAPTEFGIPLEIYCFSANKEWIAYEEIQSDIFDHIYAVIPKFDLRIYQKPSSYSIERHINKDNEILI
ncbi:MAG: mechanosensitive ion channel family protein [Candidatus Limimorpha sp.]